MLTAFLLPILQEWRLTVLHQERAGTKLVNKTYN